MQRPRSPKLVWHIRFHEGVLFKVYGFTFLSADGACLQQRSVNDRLRVVGHAGLVNWNLNAQLCFPPETIKEPAASQPFRNNRITAVTTPSAATLAIQITPIQTSRFQSGEAVFINDSPFDRLCLGTPSMPNSCRQV